MELRGVRRHIRLRMSQAAFERLLQQFILPFDDDAFFEQFIEVSRAGFGDDADDMAGHQDFQSDLMLFSEGFAAIANFVNAFEELRVWFRLTGWHLFGGPLGGFHREGFLESLLKTIQTFPLTMFK